MKCPGEREGEIARQLAAYTWHHSNTPSVWHLLNQTLACTHYYTKYHLWYYDTESHTHFTLATWWSMKLFESGLEAHEFVCEHD